MQPRTVRLPPEAASVSAARRHVREVLTLAGHEDWADDAQLAVSELVQPEKDQFALELDHFAECILQNKEPRPTGQTGLIDMKIIAALQESIKTGRTVKVA